MPDPVVEWLRVTILLKIVDLEDLNFTRNGTQAERKALAEAEAANKTDNATNSSNETSAASQSSSTNNSETNQTN
jgi:hypothetical protein